MKAKSIQQKSFKTNLDESLSKLNAISQDIVGREMQNLIKNRLKVVPKTTKEENTNYKQELVINTGNNGSSIEKRVKDNGDGISEIIKDRIFKPFFTTKSTGHGTGLDLSLSYDIIKAHGGELKVSTKEGKGSEFIIQLPVKST